MMKRIFFTVVFCLVIFAAFAWAGGSDMPPAPGKPGPNTDLSVRSVTMGVTWHGTGTGSPEGVEARAVGSTYRRTDGGSGTTFYIKETGGSTSTGWVAMVSGSVIGATINDSAGNGDTTEAWSADKIFDELALKQDASTAATDAEVSAAISALSLDTASQRAAEDTLTDGSNLPDGAAIIAYLTAQGYLTSESDPNALLTAGTDNVKDTHIDWGAGANQVDATDVPFADTNSDWTATNLGAALEEMVAEINGGSPNSATAKVHWSQLTGVPAGFADGADASGSGGVDEAYGSGWNADTDAPEKDDIYDYLHQFDADDDGDFTDETWYAALLTTSGITRGASGTGIPDILGSYNIYHIGTLTANREVTWQDAAGTVAFLADVPAITSALPVPVFTLNIKDIADTVDDVKKKFPRGITLTGVYGICVGGTNVVGRLYEVDSDGDDSDAVGIDSADWTITTSQFSDTSFTNAAIDDNDWLQWDTTSVSGSVTNFTIVVWGYET